MLFLDGADSGEFGFDDDAVLLGGGGVRLLLGIDLLAGAPLLVGFDLVMADLGFGV